MVSLLPQRPGQKEQRYVQRLSDPSIFEESPEETAATEGPPPGNLRERVEALEAAAGDLRTELQQAREELASFRRQFE